MRKIGINSSVGGNGAQLIQPGAAMRYKSGTFEHLSQANREVGSMIRASLPAMFDIAGNVNVVYGMIAGGGNITGGVIYYDGSGITGANTYNINTGLTTSAGNIGDFFLLSDGSTTGPETFVCTGNSGGAVTGSTPVWLVPGTFVGNGLNADPTALTSGMIVNAHQPWTCFVGSTTELAAAYTPTAPDNVAYQIGTVSSLIIAWQATESVYGLNAEVNTGWIYATPYTGGSVGFGQVTGTGVSAVGGSIGYRQLGTTVWIKTYLSLTTSGASQVNIHLPFTLVPGHGTFSSYTTAPTLGATPENVSQLFVSGGSNIMTWEPLSTGFNNGSWNFGGQLTGETV